VFLVVMCVSVCTVSFQISKISVGKREQKHENILRVTSCDIVYFKISIRI